jgi:nitric oxide reductase NorD protein
MEEWVGQLWHNMITRAARREYPEAAVRLDEIRRPAAILFRALGGDGGLRIETANETETGARRSLLSRIAGSNRRAELAWRDEDTLRLPARIAWFAERELNRELYLWLAALAARSTLYEGDWLQKNAAASAALLASHPGLKRRHQRLVEAHLEQRPDPRKLKRDEAEQERMIRHALLQPQDATTPLSAAAVAPQPVPLWLHPEPPGWSDAPVTTSEDADSDENTQEQHSEQVDSDKRRRGEHVDMPDGKDGLLAFRLESLFTRAEFVNVDRTTEENEDEDAVSALEDMDVVSVARDRKHVASRLRFDLDLPPEDNDDLYLGEGIPLPEWDYRQQLLQPDHCRLQRMQARDAEPSSLPQHLQVKARRLRRLFEALKPRRQWLNAQADGSELDLNALIDHATDRLRGIRTTEASLYRRFENAERDLSCLLLADLSLSTDAHVSNEQRVIDVIRDSLFLFSEALQATGDRFALYGFSSRRRDHVRFHALKDFSTRYDDRVRGRIQAIRPGYYTRMGAAIRHATNLIDKEPSRQKLLLLLTDGKPNDLDKYEGRYGVEDTRRAVHEALERGIRPFCVTIDEKAGDYLPYLFGSTSYILVRNASELPAKLPLLYARLTSE